MKIKHRKHTLDAVRGLSLGVFLCLAVFLFPFAFLVEQNYGMLQKIALETKPSLLIYLEREVLWLRVFFFGAGLATVAAISFVAYRVLKHSTAPMSWMEKHWKHLQRTGDWSTEAPSHHANELDQAFLANHRAFQNYLLDEVRMDRSLLSQMDLSALDRKNRAIVENLLKRYERRGGAPGPTPIAETSGFSEASSAAAPLRRVS